MWKLIRAFKFQSHLLISTSQNYNSTPCKSLISLISSSSTFSHNRPCSSSSDLDGKSFVLASYLIASLKFSKHRALSVSSTFSRTNSLENPKKVVHFFKGLGFSDSHIQSIARLPELLFYNVERTLKPKVVFFQELGLSGPQLSVLISRHPTILTRSLDRALKPSIDVIIKVLDSDGKCRSKEQLVHNLLLILTRCARILSLKCTVEANILYLKSYGVVGSQLSSLLLREPRVFTCSKEKLEQLVSRAVGMNFTRGSRMLVHAINTLSCININTLKGRFEVFLMLGFCKDEIDSMFRKSPMVFKCSEANLRLKLEFLLNVLKMDKMMIVRSPQLLSYSLEKRVVPRYEVVEILKSRGLLRADPAYGPVVTISDQKFLDKYILGFRNDAEELQLAYEAKLRDTCRTAYSR